MVTTVMREVDLQVQVTQPEAAEVQKLENKSEVMYVYIGPPVDKRLGTEPRIQLADDFATMNDEQPEDSVSIKDLRETVTMSYPQRRLNTSTVFSPGPTRTPHTNVNNKVPTQITSTMEDNDFIQSEKAKALPRAILQGECPQTQCHQAGPSIVESYRILVWLCRLTRAKVDLQRLWRPREPSRSFI